MLVSTQALVLHTTPYSETSIIARVFTRELGVRSYIIKGVRGGKSRARMNLLQPLSYLDAVVYANPRSTLNYIKEMHPARQFSSLTVSPVHSAVVFFINELLYKTLREEEANPILFGYVVETLAGLDAVERVPVELPIVFMLRLSQHLGIEPLDNYSIQEPLFNMKEGCFVPHPSKFAMATDSNIAYLLNPTESLHLHYFLEMVHSSAPAPILPLQQRIDLINILLQYFQAHISDFRHFNSHEVLHAVLE